MEDKDQEVKQKSAFEDLKGVVGEVHDYIYSQPRHVKVWNFLGLIAQAGLFYLSPTYWGILQGALFIFLFDSVLNDGKPTIYPQSVISIFIYCVFLIGIIILGIFELPKLKAITKLNNWIDSL